MQKCSFQESMINSGSLAWYTVHLQALGGSLVHTVVYAGVAAWVAIRHLLCVHTEE